MAFFNPYKNLGKLFVMVLIFANNVLMVAVEEIKEPK
jgi:hypothetical protein